MDNCVKDLGIKVSNVLGFSDHAGRNSFSARPEHEPAQLFGIGVEVKTNRTFSGNFNHSIVSFGQKSRFFGILSNFAGGLVQKAHQFLDCGLNLNAAMMEDTSVAFGDRHINIKDDNL